MRNFLPKTALAWIEAIILIVAILALIVFVRVVVVDGDSMTPLATGDRLIVVKGLIPRSGDIVLFTSPKTGEPMVKLAIETIPGQVCPTGILRPGQIYVEGTNPLSEKVGTIPLDSVIGVVRAVIIMPHSNLSSVEKEDGALPDTGYYRLEIRTNPPKTVSHLNGEAMTTWGDARRYFPTGTTIVTETMGKYKVTGSFVIPPNHEGLGGGTVIEIDPPDFCPPGEERIVRIDAPSK